jgi:ribosomal protein L11 methyltransferase
LAFEVLVPPGRAEEAIAILHELGTTGIEESGDRLLAYYLPRPGLAEALAQALARLPGARLRAVPVPEVDWVARFRAGFQPFAAAGFQVAPPWAVPDAPPERLLVVEPGAAFGTGTHETTRLCLRALGERAVRGRVLDVGCGSAILAIAALRRGAASAVGVDNDPEALAWAAHHARLNGVALSLFQGDAGRAVRPASVDLVLANLTAPLLLAESGALSRLPRPGGALVLSGFLLEDAADVRAAYSARAATLLEDGDWGALVVEARA